MYKVGILYICTGKYNVFWKDFYSSINKFFLPDAEKYIFVWTDSEEIFNESKLNDHIICYEQHTEKWPFPTLKRFNYFLRAENELKEMDYLIFMNGNLRVNEVINTFNILPQDNEELFVTLHPGFYARSPADFTYDNNPDCLAYIKKGEGKHYYAGGFNGGKTQAYLAMIRCLAERIDKDLEKDIIALWHDESHLNRYINDYDENKYRILSPAFCYPEGWKLPFEEKITVRDKNKVGGHDYLRK